jgi:hypothetical protein
LPRFGPGEGDRRADHGFGEGYRWVHKGEVIAMPVVVRPLDEAGRAEWEPLWRGYNAFYQRPSIGDEITQTTWTRFMAPGVPMQVLGAFEDDRLLGIAQYLFHFSTTAIGLTCYLQDLFRSTGGTRQGCQPLADRGGLCGCRGGRLAGVYWQTHQKNHDAMMLYNKVAEKSAFSSIGNCSSHRRVPVAKWNCAEGKVSTSG